MPIINPQKTDLKPAGTSWRFNFEVALKTVDSASSTAIICALELCLRRVYDKVT